MLPVFLDLERMKYPNTGMYHFCLHLGNHILKHKTIEDFTIYLPKSLKGIFGDESQYITRKVYHKFFMAGVSHFKVWHMTNQHSKFFPTNRDTKMVLTIHDLNYLYKYEEGDRRRKKYADLVQRKIDRADSITCISQFSLNDVKQNLDTQGKQMQVIYNGCNFTVPAEAHEPAAKPVRPFLYSIGTIVEKKNFHVIAALLQTTDYDLIISGSGSAQYAQQIKSEAKKFNAEHRVTMTGPISEEDKKWYLENCKAFVFPSLSEGFGLPVLEAMYYGKPVFLSNLTSLPEVGGPLAYYFDNFSPEHMQSVFAKGMHHYETHRPAEKIKEWALKFSWDNAALSYLNLYRELGS